MLYCFDSLLILKLLYISYNHVLKNKHWPFTLVSNLDKTFIITTSSSEFTRCQCWGVPARRASCSCRPGWQAASHAELQPWTQRSRQSGHRHCKEFKTKIQGHRYSSERVMVRIQMDFHAIYTYQLLNANIGAI